VRNVLSRRLVTARLANGRAVPNESVMFTIVFAEGVAEDLKALRAFERTRILDQIDQQLMRQPTQESRGRKVLRGLTPPWEHAQPVWELRVGEYRVFYDVDEAAGRVIVRAVRRKPPHKMAEEII
jgi:mRNA-degrading endonuclease RelE of RelBE toxin-antitoxin system